MNHAGFFSVALIEIEDQTVQDIYSLQKGEQMSRQRKSSTIANEENIVRLPKRLADGFTDIPPPPPSFSSSLVFSFSPLEYTGSSEPIDLGGLGHINVS